jgi:uncharacterized membrane protein YcjF (UPF0283 family)
MIDPNTVVSWPAAAVAIVIILTGAALQIVNIVMTNRVRQETHHVRQDAAQAAHQTQHNGGSTQRDEISVIRVMLEDHVTQDAAWKLDVEGRLPPAPAP